MRRSRVPGHRDAATRIAARAAEIERAARTASRGVHGARAPGGARVHPRTGRAASGHQAGQSAGRRRWRAAPRRFRVRRVRGGGLTLEEPLCARDPSLHGARDIPATELLRGYRPLRGRGAAVRAVDGPGADRRTGPSPHRPRQAGAASPRAGRGATADSTGAGDDLRAQRGGPAGGPLRAPGAVRGRAARVPGLHACAASPAELGVDPRPEPPLTAARTTRARDPGRALLRGTRARIRVLAWTLTARRSSAGSATRRPHRS